MKSDISHLSKTCISIEKGIKGIHKRIDDHMENEEKEQAETVTRLTAIEKSQFEFQTKAKIWVMVLIGVGTLLAPILRDIVYLWIFNEDQVAALGYVLHFLPFV